LIEKPFSVFSTDVGKRSTDIAHTALNGNGAARASETLQLLPILRIGKGEVPDARIGTRPT
jgi:hypothetical protein